MKLFTLRFLPFVLLLAGAVAVRAQAPSDAPTDLDQQLTAIEKLITQDAQSPAPAAPSPSSATNAPATSLSATNSPATNSPSPIPAMSADQLRSVRCVHTLQQAVKTKDFAKAILLANNLGSFDMSDAAQKALATIVPELQKLKDAQDAEGSEQSKSVLDRASKAVVIAKEAKDLDPVLADLAEAIKQSQGGRYGSDRQNAYLQLQAAMRFVKGWQSYLIDQSAGNAMQAANDLRNLTNGNDTFMPIPRSEILARALKVSTTETQVVDSKVEVHSFDDISAAISQLQLLQRSGNYNADVGGLINSLQSLQNAYLAYQDKNYAGALQQMQNYPFMVMAGAMVGGGGVSVDKSGTQSSLREEIIALKDTLLVKIVQGLLNLPDAPEPQKDEHAQDYLLRLAALREKAADWAGLLQILEVYQQICGPFNPSQPWLAEDLTGLHAYLVGEKLDAAGQNLDAIRSFRQALATLGKFFPADAPAAKLKDLEKKYPDLYKTALEEPISPKPVQ